MKRKIFVFIPLIVFIVLIYFLWDGLDHDPRLVPSPLVGKKMPAFSVSTLYSPKKNISDKDLLGHVVLLNVFATWCLSCRVEHPVLMDHSRCSQLKMVGLNYKDDRGKAKKWLKQFGNPYDTVLFDPKGQLGIDLGVYGTPETFILDEQGKIRYKILGVLSHEKWRHNLVPVLTQLGIDMSTCLD